MHTTDPEELRTRLSSWRRSLDPAEVAGRSATAAATLAGILAGTRRVASYLPVRGELDPAPAIELVVTRPAVGLPRVEGERIDFVTDWTDVTPGPFGIASPVGGRIRPVTWFDAVIVPSVAVDRTGTRWGHGRGYYDRALGEIDRSAPGRPVLVALAHHEQVVAELRREAWDVPMDVIVTPSEVIDLR